MAERRWRSPVVLIVIFSVLWSLAGSAVAQRITLDVYANVTADQRDIITEAYRAVNPNVDLIWSFTGGSDYWDQFTVRLLGGNAPDIVLMRDWAGELVEQGAFLSLDSLIARDGVEIAEWSKSEGYLTHQGKRYFLPWVGWTGTVMYNEKLFEEAGLGAPEVSWTWDDLLELARKLTRTSGEGVLVQAGFAVPVHGLATGGVREFVVQNGARLVSEDLAEIFPDVPETLEALEFLTSLVQEYRVMPPLATYGGRSLFNEGRLAILQDVYSALPAIFERNPPFKWDVTSMPKWKGPGGMFAAGGFGISAQSSRVEEAWEFIKWSHSEEGQRIMAPSFRGMPVNESVLFSSEYLYEIADINLEALVRQVVTDSIPFIPPPRSGEVGTIMNGVLNRMINQGQIAPAAGLEMIRTEVNALLAGAR